jgi:hypothetical protein
MTKGRVIAIPPKGLIVKWCIRSAEKQFDKPVSNEIIGIGLMPLENNVLIINRLSI